MFNPAHRWAIALAPSPHRRRPMKWHVFQLACATRVTGERPPMQVILDRIACVRREDYKMISRKHMNILQQSPIYLHSRAKKLPQPDKSYCRKWMTLNRCKHVIRTHNVVRIRYLARYGIRLSSCRKDTCTKCEVQYEIVSESYADNGWGCGFAGVARNGDTCFAAPQHCSPLYGSGSRVRAARSLRL
jgi:hypothetical protein